MFTGSPQDYAALKSEIVNDPLSLGYSAKVSVGDVSGVADLINTIRASVNVQLGEVQCHKVRSCISLGDWNKLTVEERAYIHMILDGETVNLSDGMIDNNLVQAGGIWAPGSGAGSAQARGLDSRSRLMTMKQRKASRAEELFGIDTFFSHSHVSSALNS
jgi:hypothetical protein